MDADCKGWRWGISPTSEARPEAAPPTEYVWKEYFGITAGAPDTGSKSNVARRVVHVAAIWHLGVGRHPVLHLSQNGIPGSIATAIAMICDTFLSCL